MKKKILLTGAGGRLGSYLREPLSEICSTLVSTDIKENIGKLNENEKYFSADLSNFDHVLNKALNLYNSLEKKRIYNAKIMKKKPTNKITVIDD